MVFLIKANQNRPCLARQIVTGDRRGGGGTSLYGLYGDVPLDRVWFTVLNRVYNFPRVCPKQGIQFRASVLNSVHDLCESVLIISRA